MSQDNVEVVRAASDALRGQAVPDVPIDHVTLEVPQERLADCVGFWELLGFVRVPLPDQFADRNAWMYHGGSTIHLISTEEPVVPPVGHAAVVLDSYDATVESLRAAGFEARPQTAYWGAARAYLTDPAGHTVEVMAAPPPIAEALSLEQPEKRKPSKPPGCRSR